jgi:NAD(P)-dependent dehydrogenase (short-subunit alcohol dehydrogenase family)
VLNGRNEQRLEETRCQLSGAGHICIVGDLADRSAITELARTKMSLNGFVHCVGISKPVPLRLASDVVIDQTFNTNLMSMIFLLRDLLKANRLEVGASIIFMSSIASLTGTQGTVLYSSSKAALMGAVRPLAVELSRKKMRINSVAPAVVKTEIWTADQEAWLQKQRDNYPLGLGEAIDVANAVAFLLSDASAFMTGTEMVLDGGCTYIE